jgi:16S rRNA G527 N7-methylase RsmG
MYEKLIEVFKDWNSKINLSAIRDDEGIKIKHIQDSLEGNKILQQLFSSNEKKDIVDV